MGTPEILQTIYLGGLVALFVVTLPLWLILGVIALPLYVVGKLARLLFGDYLF